MAKNTFSPKVEFDSPASDLSGSPSLPGGSASAKAGKFNTRRARDTRTAEVGTSGTILGKAVSSAREFLLSTTIYGVLLLSGVWASVNLLRWFWREIL